MLANQTLSLNQIYVMSVFSTKVAVSRISCGKNVFILPSFMWPNKALTGLISSFPLAMTN